ncbi:hypothetical protein BDW68DRAFT_162645 [Aspergillus falconensis]
MRSSTSRSESLLAPSASSTQSQMPSTASASHHSNNGDSNDVSKGALAGAIVGSIIGTALLTLLVAYLFFRRRQNQPPKRLENNSGPTLRSSQPPFARLEKSNPGSDFSLAAITASPPTTLPCVRASLYCSIKPLCTLITTTSPPRRQRISWRMRLRNWRRYNSRYLPEPIERMLGQKSVQRHVIRHALIYALLRAIRPETDRERRKRGGLLPEIFAAQPDINRSSASTDSALSSWRMLTSHLYAQPQRKSTFANDDTTL